MVSGAFVVALDAALVSALVAALSDTNSILLESLKVENKEERMGGTGVVHAVVRLVFN